MNFQRIKIWRVVKVTGGREAVDCCGEFLRNSQPGLRLAGIFGLDS